MNRKYKDLTKNTLLFSISTFGAKFIAFLLLPLYTHVLSTEAYGVADLITSTVAIILPVLTLNIQDAVLRFCLDKEYEPDDVISISIKVISISCVPFLLIWSLLFLTNIKVNNYYIFFVFLIFVANALYNSISMYVRAIDKVYVFMIGGLINTGASCILNIFFLLVLKWQIIGYLWAYVGGTIIAVIYMFLASGLHKKMRLSTHPELMKQMIVYSFPLVFNSLAWWINSASDRYIVTFFKGAALNGVYSIAYKIPTILATLQAVFYNAWSISAIKEYDKNDSDGFIGNTYMSYFTVSGVFCSIIMLLNIPLSKVLYANDFFFAWHYVPFLLFGTLFNGLALFEGSLFSAVKKTKMISATTVLGALINTILNLILVPSIGAYGAAVATLTGYFTVWFIRAFCLRSIIKIKISWMELGLFIVLLLIQSVLCSQKDLYALQIVVFTSLIIVMRKRIISILRALIKKKRSKI